MAPKLYMIPASPPVRAVLMTAKSLGIHLDLKAVNLMAGDHLKDEYLKLNPGHTVPTLDDNGFVLWESAAIMAYLVSKYGKDDSLYPQDVQKRAIIDQLLHFSTSSFGKFIVISKAVFTRKTKKADVPKEDIEKVLDCINTLEKIIGNKNFVTGYQFTIADFSFLAWLATWNIAFPIDSSRFPSVTAWCKRMEKLPVFEVNREGLEMFSKFWAASE